MKQIGAVAEFSRERSDDLMRAYDEYFSTCRYIRMNEVYSAIVNMPSARFWVSEKRAGVVLYAIMRGENVLQNMRPTKREMYEEIYSRTMRLRKENPHLSVEELCATVLCQPAPKFYLAPGSAKAIVCKARKEWIRRKHQRLRLL